jgi:hypothetical protein
LKLETDWYASQTRTLSCGRCGSRNVRSLGAAASSLEWFVCGACGSVWGARLATLSVDAE